MQARNFTVAFLPTGLRDLKDKLKSCCHNRCGNKGQKKYGIFSGFWPLVSELNLVPFSTLFLLYS